MCVFCKRGAANEKLHSLTSLDTSIEWKQFASDLQDTELMVRFSGLDLIAAKIKYHNPCRNAFQNRHRSFLSKQSPSKASKILESRALQDLFGFIETSIEDGGRSKLSWNSQRSKLRLLVKTSFLCFLKE